MDETLQLIGNAVSVISGIVIVILALRRFPLESKASDVNALDVISEASVALIEPMKTRLIELEKENEKYEKEAVEKDSRIDTLTHKAERQEKQLAYERARIELLNEWANRLQDQVRKMGGDPVTFTNGDNKPKKESKL